LALLLLPSFVFARFVDFADFPLWGEDSIEAVKEAGVMTGYSDGTFRPDDTINRAEALTILFRTKSMDIGDTEYVRNFSDVPRDAWFADAVNTAVAEGWINGYEDGTFRPDNSINNAEWATLLQRVFSIEPDEENVPSFSDVPARIWFGDSVAAMYANGLIRTDRASFFHPEAGVTRASAAWTISMVLRMPRLLGTSETNDFTGVKIDSRRVAYPRGSDFNPNLQGYDIERSVLKVETNADTAPISVSRDSDWQLLGQLRLTNSLDNRVELSSLEFKLRFESTNVGPDRNFEVQVVGPGIDSETHLDRTGSALFSGLENVIEPGDILALRIKIKPDAEQYFYSQEGEGVLSVEQVLGSTTVTLETEEDYGRTVFRTTPIEFVTRQFTPIRFNP
jgi:hypothetical protein